MTIPIFVNSIARETLIIGREKYTGAFRLGLASNSELSEIPIPASVSRDLQVEATFNPGDAVVIIGYDPTKMIASGASLQVSEQRLGIYLVSMSFSTPKTPVLEFTGQYISGELDQQIFVSQLDDEKTAIV